MMTGKSFALDGKYTTMYDHDMGTGLSYIRLYQTDPRAKIAKEYLTHKGRTFRGGAGEWEWMFQGTADQFKAYAEAYERSK